MSRNLYVTATEARSGKSAVSLGLAEMLLQNVKNLGFFRPFIRDGPGATNDINLISSYFNLKIPYQEMYAYTASEAIKLASLGKQDELIAGIIDKYKKLEEKCDFILCEGTDFRLSTKTFEFDINAQIAELLSCPVILVANAYRKTEDATLQSIEMALESLAVKGVNVVATVVNRADPEEIEKIVGRIKELKLAEEQLVYAMPYEKFLEIPTVKEIASFLKARVLYGEELLEQHVYGYVVAAMQLQHFLEYVRYGSFIIVPGDRADVIVGCLAAVASRAMPYISGILLTGGMKPEVPVRKLIEGFEEIVPILIVKEATYPAARKFENIPSVISPDDELKIIRALGLFEENIDTGKLIKKITRTKTPAIPPRMFEYGLIEKARARRQHIVLPEGEEERILRAVEILRSRKVVEVTLLGDEKKISAKITKLGLHLKGVNIIEPRKSTRFEDYVRTFYDLRKEKGVTMDIARDTMLDRTFFGTMMVYKNDADGMVSGAVHTTANTIRPALEFVKTKPGFSIVSSVFFMCLEDRVLVYGDCAINIDPDAAELAEIAIASAHTAKVFGIEPRVALMSYSTGESGKGKDVEKVRRATKIAKKMAKELYPGLKIDGPLQYDAAIDPEVAKTKLPGSEVAGRATVFIFPDLHTGNITYKAVQRSARAVAIGPVLQGLKKPVNDLSRGCTIPDIVNTVAITAIQAQSEKG